SRHSLAGRSGLRPGGASLSSPTSVAAAASVSRPDPLITLDSAGPYRQAATSVGCTGTNASPFGTSTVGGPPGRAGRSSGQPLWSGSTSRTLSTIRWAMVGSRVRATTTTGQYDGTSTQAS